MNEPAQTPDALRAKQATQFCLFACLAERSRRRILDHFSGIPEAHWGVGQSRWPRSDRVISGQLSNLHMILGESPHWPRRGKTAGQSVARRSGVEQSRTNRRLKSVSGLGGCGVASGCGGR